MVTRTASTKKTSTAKKSAAKPKAKAKPAAAPAVAETPVAEAAVPAAAKALGKRELIDRTVKASGVKKKAVKPVVEALLMELGEALSRGQTLNLQPFGKANIKRQKTLENAEVIEVRVRRSKQAVKAAEAQAAEHNDDPAPVPDPLAEAAE